LVDDIQQVKVGGVMASLIPKEIEQVTGIKPIESVLDKPYMLDKDINLIVDDLPLDYSILHEIDYEYPIQNAYITFMSKGCSRKCKFCAVPKIEPNHKGFVSTIDKFNHITRLYGEQKDLLLMDNNALASKKDFSKIITEIKQMGFISNSTYTDSNQLRIAIRNLRLGINNKAYIRYSYKLIHILGKKTKGKTHERYYKNLEKYELLHLETTTKINLISVYPKIAKTYEKIRFKRPKLRFIDFNQGIDCRYINEENMKLLSEIPIRPLRIAFDYITLKKQYINAVTLAAKYGIKELSNYILFNFIDKPDELYKRLEINNNLSKELNIHIYSFPMKYLPLFGEDAKHRNYIGKHWNKKFIRAIQSILNVTKGIVAPSCCNEKGNFFKKAFGNDLSEFNKLLYMPETYIIYRKLFEELGYTQQWQTSFRKLTEEELKIILPIIETGDFKNYEEQIQSPSLKKLMIHYTISRDIVKKAKIKGSTQTQLKQIIDNS